MPKLFEVRGQQVFSGLHPGAPNQTTPLWKRGSNVLFKDGAVKVAPLQTLLVNKIGSLPVLGIGVVNNITTGVPAIVWGDRGKLYKSIDPPNVVDVTRTVGGDYTGSDEDLWSIVAFGQSVFATNGVDQVQYLADINAGNFVDIGTPTSDLPLSFRCKHLAVNKAFIIAINTDNTSEEVRWSDEDNVLVWTPDPANKARDLQIRDLGSDIVAIEDFADDLVLYGRNQAHIFQFTGAPFFFSSRHLIEGIGASGKHQIVVVERTHYGMGPNGIWRHDGATLRYIDDPSMHQYVYEEKLELDLLHTVVSWYDPNENEVYFSFPSRDEEEGITVSYNPQYKLWSLHDYYRTAAASGGIFEAPILGDSFGNLYLQGLTSLVVGSGSNPMGISDVVEASAGYGFAGYGQLGYDGQDTWE